MVTLKQLRKKAGFRTQAALAECVSLTVPVSAKTISAWEQGTRRPTYEATKRLAEIFGLPFTEICKIVYERTTNQRGEK